MLLWAELDDNNIVKNVIIIADGEPNDGLDWVQQNLEGRWVQTWEDGSQRFRCAGVGMFFDVERDAFYTPKPDDGNDKWYFDDATAQWILPEVKTEPIVLDPDWTPQS